MSTDKYKCKFYTSDSNKISPKVFKIKHEWINTTSILCVNFMNFIQSLVHPSFALNTMGTLPLDLLSFDDTMTLSSAPVNFSFDDGSKHKISHRTTHLACSNFSLCSFHTLRRKKPRDTIKLL